MPPDYSTEQMISDIIGVVQDAMPTIIAAAITVAAINFVVGWFMYILFEKLGKAYRG